jgi:hypothetical protein
MGVELGFSPKEGASIADVWKQGAKEHIWN